MRSIRADAIYQYRVNHDVARALSRLETYLGRVKARWEARDVYQAMSDTAELAEIALRFYVTLREAARTREAATNTEPSNQQ